MRPYILQEVKRLMIADEREKARELLLLDFKQHINDMLSIHHSAVSFAFNPMRRRTIPEIKGTCDHVQIPTIQFVEPKVFESGNSLFNCIGVSRHAAAFIPMDWIPEKRKFFFFSEKPSFTRGERNLRKKVNWLLDLIPYAKEEIRFLNPMSGIVLSPEQHSRFFIYNLRTKLNSDYINKYYTAPLDSIGLNALIAIYQLTECANYISDL